MGEYALLLGVATHNVQMISKNIIFGKRFVRFLCFLCLLYPIFLYYHLFPIPPALFLYKCLFAPE